MKDRIIRNCDKCNNEDTISCITGLCISCEEEDKKENSCFHCEKEEGTHEVDGEYWCVSCYSDKADHDYEMIKDRIEERKVYIV